MITAAQQHYIEDHAYVPEHIPQYVTAISKMEPFLFGDFVAYAEKDRFIFVGYPLEEAFKGKKMKKGAGGCYKALQSRNCFSDRPRHSIFPRKLRSSSL